MHTQTIGCARQVAGALAALAIGAAGAGAHGQACTPEWTSGFPNAPVFDEEVRSVAVFDSGAGPQLYAAGPFTTIGQTQARGVARWTATGWQEVGGGVSGGYPWSSQQQPWVLAVLTIGSVQSLYLGGSFESPGLNIVRWNGTGWAPLGPGLNDTVRAMTVYDDGTGPALYAAGHFYMSGSNQPMRGVAKWTGSAWQALGSGLTLQGAPWLPDVGHGYSLAALDLGDGPKLYVGGRFSQAGGVSANNIACWNGQQWSAVGSGVFGAEAQIMKVGAFDHGFGLQLTIAGRFSLTQVGPVRARVARWTGSQWVQVGSDLSGDPTHIVNTFAVLPGPSGPSLHVGGIFTGASWLNGVNYVARLGAADWVSLDAGMSDYVWSLVTHQDAGGASVYAAGKFGLAGGAVAGRVARWDGADWHGYGTNLGLSGLAHAACLFDDGSGEKLYVGGDFAGAGDLVCNGIAVWNGAEVRGWGALGSGVVHVNGAPGAVYALAPYDGGAGPALYAAGAFAVAGGGPSFNIARWDGQFWSSPGGNGLNDAGRALVVHDEGNGPALYVGGAFGSASGVIATGVARWNGSTWSAVGPPSPGASVNALASFDDGWGTGPDLYAAGQFLQIGGISVKSIARWDGAAWWPVGAITTSPSAPWPGVVHALRVFDDGGGPGLYAGGVFGAAGSVPVFGNIARLRSGAWSPVGSVPSLAPTGPVYALATGDDGKGPALYVGGSFHAQSGASHANSLVRWDGAAWSGVGAGVTMVQSMTLPPPPPSPGHVRAIAASGRSMFVAGQFGWAGGMRSDHVAEWRGCPCYADCNSSGTLTVADFVCFQSRFVAGDPWADCNGNAALTVADFVCFQTEFVYGCP